jgi:transcriptional regulator with XRE-family HTH domain
MPKTRAFEVSPLPLDARAALHALGTRLALARKERGYSQRAFSDISEMSLPTLVKMERGEPSVQIGYYARAAWLLDVAFPGLGSA